MDGELHTRIDAGIKRGKRIKPHMLETRARNEAGQFLSKYTPELKQRAIERGLAALECGARVEQVADELQIPRATIYSWLIGADAGKARTLFFDGQCAMHLADMADPMTTPTPLDVTRKRELLSGWIKVAERRDPRAWAQQQQQITVKTDGPVSISVVSFAGAEQQSAVPEKPILAELVQVDDK